MIRFRRNVWVVPALFILACLPYANTPRNAYVFDDVLVYADNPFVANLGNLRHLFSHAYFGYSLEASYRPVCTLSYFIDRALYGDWLPGPHLTNILLYGCVVLLLYACFKGITRSRRPAFAGAACFALHPVHTEVVNSIGFREDILAPLFLLASWLIFRRARNRQNRAWLVPAWALYALATLSKESAVVFPLLAILLAWADPGVARGGAGTDTPAADERKRLARRPFRIYLAGVAAVTVGFLLLRFRWMHFAGESEVPRLGGSLAGTLIADVRIQAHYLLLWVFPADLRALYGPDDFPARLDTGFLLALAILLSVAAVTWRYRRRRPVVFAFLWWFICLAPVANLYPIFNPMAERYLFLPGIGPALLTGWLIDRGLTGRYRRPVAAAALLVAVLFGARTFIRNRDWSDSVTIWRRIVERAPEDPLVLGNLATARYRSGALDEAARAAERALAIGSDANPAFHPAPAHIVLGCVSYAGGHREAALRHFLDAKDTLPCRPDVDRAVYENLGLVYREQKRWDAAARAYTRAAQIAGFRPGLWTRAAHAWLMNGDHEKAAELWARARALDTGVPPFESLLSAVQAREAAHDVAP